MVGIASILFALDGCSTVLNGFRLIFRICGLIEGIMIIACACLVLHCMGVLSFVVLLLPWSGAVLSSDSVFSSPFPVLWRLWPALVFNILGRNYLISWRLLLKKHIVDCCVFEVHLLEILWLSFFILLIVWNCDHFFSASFLSQTLAIILPLRFLKHTLVPRRRTSRIKDSVWMICNLYALHGCLIFSDFVLQDWAQITNLFKFHELFHLFVFILMFKQSRFYNCFIRSWLILSIHILLWFWSLLHYEFILAVNQTHLFEIFF